MNNKFPKTKSQHNRLQSIHNHLYQNIMSKINLKENPRQLKPLNFRNIHSLEMSHQHMHIHINFSFSLSHDICKQKKYSRFSCHIH